MKTVQKLRSRPNGIEISTLMIEEKESTIETPAVR